MKKTLIRISIAAVIAAIAFFGLKGTLFATQAGAKEIQLIITVDEPTGTDKVVYDAKTRTDAETLGEYLDELQADGKLELTLAGAKTDPYGRYIVGINGILTEDSAKGPWWLFNSSTNKDCVAAGYCAGIDMAPIYDQDLFTFTFTSTY